MPGPRPTQLRTSRMPVGAPDIDKLNTIERAAGCLVTNNYRYQGTTSVNQVYQLLFQF